MAGLVRVEGRKVQKAGTTVDIQSEIVLIDSGCPYVSRGGIKLAHALDFFQIDPTGLTCLDLGSSTGGFTDCLLQRGARLVYCIDAGRGQLHWKLRNDPRVVLRERCNARFMDPADFPSVHFGLVVADLSFISLRLVLDPLVRLLQAQGPGKVDLLPLIKPQFEAGRQEVGKGGIVRDEAVRQRVLEDVQAAAAGSGFSVLGRTVSPITGMDGNVEFFLHLVWPQDSQS